MSQSDLIAVCLFGVGAIMTLSAFTKIPGFIALITSAAFCFGILIYVKMFSGPCDAGLQGAVTPDDISLQEQARLADGFDEAVIIINRFQRVVHANPAAQSLFSLKQSGNTVRSVISDPDIRALINSTLAGDTPDPVTYHVETPIERHIRVVGSGIASETEPGVVRRALVVFYDITDLVRMNTMRADFLANASHELKTPVASLLGYIETLRGHAKNDPAAQETFLGIMQQQAERMQRLIDDLLSLRRIEMVEHIAPDETGDLFLATRAAIEAVDPLASRRNVKIKYKGPKEVLVTGIQDELVQLVLNLLDNAVAFTPEGGTINLTMEIISDWTPRQMMSGDAELAEAPKRNIVTPNAPSLEAAVLRIRDQGPGFPREHLPRIGERFYKVSELSEKNKGTGLGLAIVKHIMRRHRGGLFVASQPGLGSEFTLIIPLSHKS